jgi:hypothetical protein
MKPAILAIFIASQILNSAAFAADAWDSAFPEASEETKLGQATVGSVELAGGMILKDRIPGISAEEAKLERSIEESAAKRVAARHPELRDEIDRLKGANVNAVTEAERRAAGLLMQERITLRTSLWKGRPVPRQLLRDSENLATAKVIRGIRALGVAGIFVDGGSRIGMAAAGRDANLSPVVTSVGTAVKMLRGPSASSVSGAQTSMDAE